jgi:polypeptide N-acetylgalactosaminyltransferase
MGMETWGGENIEMSIRLWTCGGRILAIPCSHVGHVFRQKTPYKFKTKDPRATIAANLNRVAEVWMDKYQHVYYAVSGNRKYGVGNETLLEERKQFRKDHKCKSFQWYTENKFYDLDMPYDLQVRMREGVGWGNDCDSLLETALSLTRPPTPFLTGGEWRRVPNPLLS